MARIGLLLCAAAAGSLVAASASARADDWPEWRGPRRDGISRERDWLAGWADGEPPRVAWRAAVGRGHSSVSVSGDRAFTMGWDGSTDTVYCLDVASGKTLWRQSYPCDTILQWPGPRATPAVYGGVVYTLGQHGQLRAWDARTGNLRWRRDLPARYNPDPDYGFAPSPLIEGELLLLNAARRGLAVRASDGTIAWGDDDGKSACVSAVPFTHDGQRGVLMVTLAADRGAANLVAVEPQSGRELWRFDGWSEKWGAMGVDPIVRDGKVFVTSAEQYRQAARFSIDGGSLRQDWSTPRVAGYTGCAVLIDAHIYLVDSRGMLKCVSWESGEIAWSERGFGQHGTLSGADGALLVQAGDSGELCVVAPDSSGYRLLRRARVFNEDGETFTAPVLANGRVYCRSYRGEVVCLVTGRTER